MKLIKKQRGATMVEYAIMVSLIAIVAIGAVTLIGKNTEGVFNKAAEAIKSSG
jgi:pilus assembly protein Flp/PilA